MTISEGLCYFVCNDYSFILWNVILSKGENCERAESQPPQQWTKALSPHYILQNYALGTNPHAQYFNITETCLICPSRAGITYNKIILRLQDIKSIHILKKTLTLKIKTYYTCRKICYSFKNHQSGSLEIQSHQLPSFTFRETNNHLPYFSLR